MSFMAALWIDWVMPTQYHDVYMHDIVEKWRLALANNYELEKNVWL